MKYRYREPHEMKDSGVEWLGMIPKEWEVKQLKYLAYSLNGFAFKSENYINHGVPIIRIGDISKFINLDNIPKVKEEIDLEKYKIKKQDILVALTGATIGKSCIYNLEEKSYLNQRVGLFRGIKIYNKFLFYYISSDMILKYIQLICNGSAQENISNLDILNFKIAFTYLNQQKIADFLDKKCEEFDSVIAKKEMLINKLEEAKKSLISEVVTGKVKVIEKENGEYGIIKREAHEMKDSGVEWLGMIPRDWEVSKIKWIAQTESGATPLSGKIEEYYDGNIRWIRTTDLNDSYVYENEINITEKAMEDCSCRILPLDTCLVAMYGGAGTIGKNGLLKISACINQAVCAILPNDKYISEFLYFYLNFYRANWMIEANGTRKDPNINQEIVRNLKFVNPSLEIQNMIVKFLKNKKIEIENIIDKEKQLIEKLKSAKQSLISEAVTGKIEVL